jgi:hypothetical protein
LENFKARRNILRLRTSSALSASIFPINAHINIKMEGSYHKNQWDLPNKASPFHFDIDLSLSGKIEALKLAHKQGVLIIIIILIRLAFSLSNENANQDRGKANSRSKWQ